MVFIRLNHAKSGYPLLTIEILAMEEDLAQHNAPEGILFNLVSG